MKEKKFSILKEILNSQRYRSIFTGADSNFFRFLCDCFVNVVRGLVSADENLIESTKVPFEKFSIREKKRTKLAIFYWLNKNCATFI